MLVSPNDASSVLTQPLDLPQQGPHPVLSLGPSLPLILLLLRSPLLHPSHRLLLQWVFVFPRKLPTEQSPWNSMLMGFGTCQKPRSLAAEHWDSVGTVARKVTGHTPAQLLLHSNSPVPIVKPVLRPISIDNL